MYTVNGLSIASIEEMANCDIVIDNSGGSSGLYGMLQIHTTLTGTLLRTPMAIQPIGLIVRIDQIGFKGSDN